MSKIKLKKSDFSVIMNTKAMSSKLADLSTSNRELWVGLAFGYVYALMTQKNPEDYEIHVAEIICDMYKSVTKELEEEYGIDLLEELHKSM